MSENAVMESAPSSAPSNSSGSESSWLSETSSKQVSTPPDAATIKPQTTTPMESKDPTGQVVAPTDPKVVVPPVDPNAPLEYTIKDWKGEEKKVTLEWMQGYFQTKGNEALAKLVTPENAPLLSHIAERTMKLNNAYQRAALIEPEYNSYKENVQKYFDSVASDPVTGFSKIMSDIGLDDKAQEALIEKMAIQLIEKREMSPEQRAAMEAQRERDRIMQEAETYKQQLEEMRVQQQAQALAPNYQASITNALTSVGFETSPAVWDAMVNAVYQTYGNQKEPISQAQFNFVAQKLALQAMSFKKQQPAPQQAQQPQVKKVVANPGHNAKPKFTPPGKFQTEAEWMEQQGLKAK